jgi:hypothetical protein
MLESLLKKVKQGIGTALDLGDRESCLQSTRNQYLDRGREYARFTLPYILPDNDDKNRGADANQHGFQGIGAQAVNHLANKLTTTLFPIQRSFFKLEFDDVAKQTLINSGYDPTELSTLLIKAEKRAETHQTKAAARVAYVDAFKSLLIAGNVLMYLPKNGNLQAIKLDRYFTRRDTSGRLVELLIKDKKAFSAMSKSVQDQLKRLKGPGVCKKDDDVTLYTWVYRIDEDTFGVTQSALGVQIKEWQEIPAEDIPWIPLMFNHTNGEDYGRGLVEDHAGDFFVIEYLSEAVAKGMVLMADIKYFLRPGSIIDLDEVATSPIGEWLRGNIEDIGILQLAKYADFKPISEVLTKYERRIGQAFLMNSAVRRDAERVTTVELRIDAQELETSLGGVYTLLAQTMQSPLAKIYLKQIGFPFPDQVIPEIVTGLAALGKVGDLDKIKQFTEMMQLPQTWPLPVQERTKWDVYAKEVAAGLSMEMPWMMTDEEYQDKQQAQAQAQQAQTMTDAMAGAAEKAGPEMLQQAMQQ